MNTRPNRSYRFKSFLLNVSERQLLEAERSIALTPKSFDILAYLVERAGHLVEKEELMLAIWPDSIVEEGNLSRAIHDLRKALGQDKNGNKFIETVPTKGYRFVAEVEEVEEVEPIGSYSGVFSRNAERRESGHPEYQLGAAVKPVMKADTSARRLRRKLIVTASAVAAVLVVVSLFFVTGSLTTDSMIKKISPETFSGQAYQHYTQGRFLVERRHKGDYENALVHFEKAIELDPNYSDAYAAKADVKVVHFWGPSGSPDDIGQARTAVKKALELDESSSYAHTILCRILTTADWDHNEAEKECRTAVELNPNDHEAQKEFAFLLHSLGRESEALAAMERAISIAPTSFNKRSRGMILYQSRHYDEAIEQLNQVELTDPNYREASRWLTRAYEMKKDYGRALESYIRLTQHAGAPEGELAEMRGAFEREGWQGVLRKMVDSPNMRTLFQAGTFAQLGDKENAFETLDQMVKRRAILLVTIQREPSLDPIRDDPRFAEILIAMNLNERK